MTVSQNIKKFRNAIALKNVRKALVRLGIFAAVLSLAFIKPLMSWIQLALDSDTFSYVILIPVVVIYLGRLRLKALADANGNGDSGESTAAKNEGHTTQFFGRPVKTGMGVAMGCWGIAAVILIVYWSALRNGWNPTVENGVAVTISAYYLSLLGGAFRFLGIPLMRVLQFSAAFLILIIPFPTPMINAIEIFFQHASAEVSYWFLTWSGTPVLRDGLSFKIPGITMRVAQECSGIRSSLVLFICSLLAGHMFLRTRWRKLFLTVFVIPLAIVRNGFRILTIGLLCVHIGPEMIESVIHKRGGPFFFVLSLIPFFLVLWWLVRGERGRAGGGGR